MILIVANISTVNLLAQEITLKDKALSEFKNEHYDKAINLLEKALEETKDDAKIYYYLGFFNHYRAYDSRPLDGYDFSYSERIFQYLNKAIELNPNYVDAKYEYYSNK
jgi:tetratricopeptide (TPR) repeat protein